MKKKILAIILASAMIISAFSAVASAVGEVSYRDMDYTQTITPGTPATGTLTWLNPTLISYSSTGVAKGFNVTLEQNKQYVFSFKATASSNVPHVINIMVLKNVMSGGFASDILSLPVIVSDMGKTAACSVRFTAPSNGQFRVLITEGSLVVDDYKLINVNYTVSVDELVWSNQSISSATELTALRDLINSYSIITANLDVKLTADIDMANANWTGFKCFAGKFDGDNHTIFNFGMGTSSIDNVGLLGKVMGKAEVSNVKITGVNSVGAVSVGALAGTVQDSTVENCSAAGRVAGVTNAGGLIGSVISSSVSGSTSSCTVEGATGIGGFVGVSDGKSFFKACSSTGTVKSSIACAGGFIGLINQTTINECYSTGAVNATTGVGGFVGTINSQNKITNSYSYGNVTVLGTLIPRLSVGGFAGSVTLGVNTIANCCTISVINAFAERVGGFLGSCDVAGEIEFINCYTASVVTITRDSDSFGSFLGELDGQAVASTSYSSIAPITVNSLAIANAPTGLAQGVTAIDFSNDDAVSQMTQKLNELSASNDSCDSWAGANAANGPELVFKSDAPQPGESIEETIEWVRNQSVVLQIPLFIFYVPIMYIISLFRGL